MSGIRSVTRRASQVGYSAKTSAPLRVDDTSNTLLIVNAGTGSTEVAIPTMISASGAKIAAGSGALVSGSATIATGLTSVMSFHATVYGATGFATGPTEVDEVIVSSITTGSVVCKGVFSIFSTGSRALSASGTATFYWHALGM